MLDSLRCPWCDEVETAQHAIFECRRVHELWSLCDCKVIQCRHGSDMRESFMEWDEMDSKIQQRGAFLAWVIWGERNEKVFNNKKTPNEVLVARVARLVEDTNKYTKMIYSQPKKGNPSLNRWAAPVLGSIKINVDAYLGMEGWVGLGVVARDHTGQVKAAAVRRQRARWTPEIAEAKAILMAMKIARRMKFRDVILESYCLTLISRLSKTATYCTELDNVLDDILSFCSDFNSMLWSHVKKDGNFVTHHLARLVPFGVQQIWENSHPMEIHSYVLSDSLSIS